MAEGGVRARRLHWAKGSIGYWRSWVDSAHGGVFLCAERPLVIVFGFLWCEASHNIAAGIVNVFRLPPARHPFIYIVFEPRRLAPRVGLLSLAMLPVVWAGCREIPKKSWALAGQVSSHSAPSLVRPLAFLVQANTLGVDVAIHRREQRRVHGASRHGLRRVLQLLEDHLRLRIHRLRGVRGGVPQ